MKSVESEVMNLAKISQGDIGFIIPCYQRPYVWRDEDVLKLFNDIKDTFQPETKDEAEKTVGTDYYIGSTLSAKHIEGLDNDKKTLAYELIDGQQRTTTLMLISIAFMTNNINCRLADVAIKNNNPRLKFDIRDEVTQLMGSYSNLTNYISPSPEAIQNNPYLSQIDNGLRVLKQAVASLKDSDQKFDIEGFSEFIFTKVQWVNTIVPDELDLNRLFSNLNTAGLQLQPVDLLKAKLFRAIISEKVIYSAIWQVCEHTENYFERNIRELFEFSDQQDLNPHRLSIYSGNGFKLKGLKDNEEISTGQSSGKTIAELDKELDDDTLHLKSNTKETEKDKNSDDAIDDPTVYCRSIISFELLLIHTLRLFNAKNNLADIPERITASNLLKIFEPLVKSNESDIKQFLQLLWQVRYQFDLWVVKWVEHDDRNDPKLRLTDITESTSNGKRYFNRTAKPLNNLVQLQAVRNFSGERSAQYWLTPLLNYLVAEPTNDEYYVDAVKNEDKKEDDVLKELERIDNILSLATTTQKEASFMLVKGHVPECQPWSAIEAYLQESNGTAFNHYWFQKLEYILWKNADNQTDDKFKAYRISSKNSVEHVHPQNEEYKNQLEKDVLDSFGNLVLLSPSENSAYSNQAVAKKKADFEAKKHCDSLKLKAIFDLLDGSKDWDKVTIEQHRDDMIKKLSDHYKTTLVYLATD